MTASETQKGYLEESSSNNGIEIGRKVNQLNHRHTSKNHSHDDDELWNCYVPNLVLDSEWLPNCVTNICPSPSPLGAYIAADDGVCMAPFPRAPLPSFRFMAGLTSGCQTNTK
jgi:hypothetical protein